MHICTVQEKPTWEFVDFEPENLSLAVLKNKPYIRPLSFPHHFICLLLQVLYLAKTISRIFNTLCFALHSLLDLIMFPKTYLINIQFNFFIKEFSFKSEDVILCSLCLTEAHTFFCKGQIIYDLIIL
jgi:hypothetical protein